MMKKQSTAIVRMISACVMAVVILLPIRVVDIFESFADTMFVFLIRPFEVMVAGVAATVGVLGGSVSTVFPIAIIVIVSGAVLTITAEKTFERKEYPINTIGSIPYVETDDHVPIRTCINCGKGSGEALKFVASDAAGLMVSEKAEGDYRNVVSVEGAVGHVVHHGTRVVVFGVVVSATEEGVNEYCQLCYDDPVTAGLRRERLERTGDPEPTEFEFNNSNNNE